MGRTANTDMRPTVSRKLELSIVLPCLDEAASVAECVRAAKRALGSCGIRGEVVVADNGSTDGSRRLAAAAGARVIFVRERGYGNALRGGIEASRGRYILMADADRSYPLSAIPQFLAALRQGADLVMGSRLRGAIAPGAMPFSHRWIGTPFFNVLLWILFGVRVSDAQCGMRAFTRRAYESMHLTSSGMEFATEMLAQAGRAKLTVREIPIRYLLGGRARIPHLRTFADGWRNLHLLLLLGPPGVLLWSGASLLAVGLLLGLGALTHVKVFGHHVNVHFAILGSALVLIGYQAVHLGRYIALLRKPSPAPRRNGTLYKSLSLEWTLVLGGSLFLAGFCVDLWLVLYWAGRNFSTLSMTTATVAVIGSTLIVLGSQIVVRGYFLAVLMEHEIKRREGESERPSPHSSRGSFTRSR